MGSGQLSRAMGSGGVRRPGRTDPGGQVQAVKSDSDGFGRSGDSQV